MTTDDERAVYTRASHAPWWEILRHAWSARRDRALVLRAPSGSLHLAGAERDPAAKPEAARPGLFGYDRAYHVALDERTGIRTVTLPGRRGGEPVDVQVRWWVDDALQVVRTETVHGWPAVRRDLDRCLWHIKDQYAAAGQQLDPSAFVRHLGEDRRLQGCGLAYRVTEVSSGENGTELHLGDLPDAGAPYPWTDSLEEYEFCKQAVREGPVALAALWLVRHPDEVRQVLDWTVGHADLVRGETAWQDRLAGLLGKLTEQEQSELSRLLRDRLVSLGRRVPGPPPPGPDAERTRFGAGAAAADGWTANGVYTANGTYTVNGANGANGRPV